MEAPTAAARLAQVLEAADAPLTQLRGVAVLPILLHLAVESYT